LNEIALPAVKNWAKMLVNELSVMETPDVKSPLKPPVEVEPSTAPAPPPPNPKLESVAVLLPSPVPLPSVRKKKISDPAMDGRPEVSTVTVSIMSARASDGKLMNSAPATAIIPSKVFLFVIFFLIG
jgi:hypothetical protein